VSRFAAILNRPGVRLAPVALGALQGASWPGNVRELESAIARAVAAARPGEVLGLDRFSDLAPREDGDGPLQSWPKALDAFRRRYFAAVLRETVGTGPARRVKPESRARLSCTTSRGSGSATPVRAEVH